jgi:cytochrome c biogenesis protein CcdA
VITLIVLVISVGLADAVNPSTLAPALLLATGPDAVRRLVGFTLGVFVVSLAGGIVLLVGPGELLRGALPHPGRHARSIAELVGGVLLLGLAAALWFGRRKVTRRLESSGSGNANGGAFALGAGIMAVELPTAIPYFAAIAAILASGAHIAFGVALVLLYNIAFVAPLLALVAIRERAGERATARLEAIGSWLRQRAPVLGAVVLALLGVAFLVVGIAGLS